MSLFDIHALQRPELFAQSGHILSNLHQTCRKLASILAQNLAKNHCLLSSKRMEGCPEIKCLPWTRLGYNALVLPPIHDQKVRLRRRCKAIRTGLGDEICQQASKAICAHLAAWDTFQSAEVVLSYMPMRSEVDLRSLFAVFPEKRWLLPRILPGEHGRMVFHLYDPQHLVVHPYGMAEPAPHLPQVPADEIQLVLAPGLAFERSGWRLGYGGGYYDRFLRRFGGASVGVVFRALLLESLPHGEYDVPVNWLVSEGGLIRIVESQEKG
jgi:5-formyltetrahydrofolate cyclo-ligase